MFVPKHPLATLQTNGLIQHLTSHWYTAGETERLVKPCKTDSIDLAAFLRRARPSLFDLQSVKLQRCQMQAGTIHITETKHDILQSDSFTIYIFPAFKRNASLGGGKEKQLDQLRSRKKTRQVWSSLKLDQKRWKFISFPTCYAIYVIITDEFFLTCWWWLWE